MTQYTIYNLIKSKWTWISFLVGFCIYIQSIGFDFVQDDAIVITDNMFVKRGVSGISSIFSHDTFYGYFKEEGKANLVQGGRYRPLSLASFALTYSLFGENPMVFHLGNMIYYGLCCSLIFIVFGFLFSRNSEDGKYLALALVLLYATHPIHTEVVANIKGRDEIFVVFFGLLSLLFLCWEDKKWFHYILSYFFFGMALLSKENALVWGILIPLIFWFFYNDTPLSSILKLWFPYVLLMITFVILRQSILGWEFGGRSNELMNNPFMKYENGRMVHFTILEKWKNISLNLGQYLKLMVYPYPLTNDYYPYKVEIQKEWTIYSIGSIVVYLGLILISIVGFLKKRRASFGMIMYLGCIFLVSNILINIGTNLSERFLFFASLGFLMSILMFLNTLGISEKNLLWISIFVSILFATLTQIRLPVWKDNYTLFTTDVHSSSQSAKAQLAAAGAIFEKAIEMEEGESKTRALLQSLEHSQKALHIYPHYSNAYLLNGNLNYYLNNHDDAIQSYKTLLKLSPDHADGIKNLQICYRDAGRYLGEKENNIPRAIEYLNEALKINSLDYETLRLLGTAHGLSGNTSKTIEFFMRAKNQRPESADAWVNLGKAYAYANQNKQRDICFKQAISIDPNIKIK